MTKRVRYNIGDIFLVPLEGDFKGVGRVLMKSKDAILIELYKIKPIVDISEFIYEYAMKEKPLTLKWCYDDGLKHGIWPIIDNKPIVEEIEMPYFWTQDSYDMKYYIHKGKYDSFDFYDDGIEIPEEDIHKYDPCGIGNEISERNRYMRKLKEVGLL